MEKTREDIRNDLIREAKEAHSKMEEAKRQLQENPLWNDPRDLVVIDWKEGRENLLARGVASVIDCWGTEEWTLEVQRHCLILNFPSLEIKNAHLNDCYFQNCGRLTISDGTAAQCVFSNFEVLFIDNCKIYESLFQDVEKGEKDLLISMENSTLSDCHFSNIHMLDDCYLCDGVGDCTIEKCTFHDVTTQREDEELFVCEDFKGKVFRRRYTYDMVDWRSCTFDDQKADPYA